MADTPDNPWQPVKDAAEKLKDALNTAAHTSPADVAHNVTDAGGRMVDGTRQSLDRFLQWVDSKVKKP